MKYRRNPPRLIGGQYFAGGGNRSFLHRLVNSRSRLLVRVLLRPIACLFYAREAFLANVGNLVYGEMFNAD